jgi:hypothetical protein
VKRGYQPPADLCDEGALELALKRAGVSEEELAERLKMGHQG